MEQTIWILLVTAVSVGFIHTILGPDHYLPFVVMARSRRWSLTKTLWITFVCGLGHVLSSIAIGLIGISLGIGVGKLENIEAFRGDIAAWILFFFGVIYFLWGIWRIYLQRPHTHKHLHDNGTMHTHEHRHKNAHGHMHTYEKAATLTPWILFIIFVLGPCEALIPLLMYPAAKLSVGGVILVSLVFSVSTIITMLLSTTLILFGFQFVKTAAISRYAHAIAGATIALSASAILFLGL